MKTLIKFRTTTPRLFVLFAIGGLALSPKVSASGGPPSNCNTSEGYQALFNVTTGFDDTAFGGRALFNDTTGSDNTAVGCAALVGNTIGIDNTATGSGALSRNISGSSNAANGYRALYNNTTGTFNTGIGSYALYSNTSGPENTATGTTALQSNTTGSGNTATGRSALQNNITGNDNTALGGDALLSNTTGSDNIALGLGAGSDLTTGDWNIDIGNFGVAGEGHTIRIGIPFNSFRSQNRTFIAGIRGVATGNDDAIPVVIDSAGQLGTTSSSRRFKTEVKPMDKASEAILALKPVTFRYQTNLGARPQFGLIAEEVAKVNPDLVVRDANGGIYTVRYDAVNAMLLNEFLKAHKKIEEQQATITQLMQEMDTVVARVNEQDSKIQKVNSQLEITKPAAKVALDN